MKKTDMELQAIRDKLRRLELEPISTADTFADPWSYPQRTQVSKAKVVNASVSDTTQFTRTHDQQTRHSVQDPQKKNSDTPQAAALATLRQRSITNASRSASNQSTLTSATASESEAVVNHRSADCYSQKANELVMQEIERLEIHAQNINERSQQQAQALLAIKRSAQQATVALRRQGIQDHPQLETIATFLANTDSAMLPHLERDIQGRFSLSHTTVDFNYAEQEAIHTAQALRNLGKPHFCEPIEAGPCLDEYRLSEQVVAGRSAASKPRRKRTKRSWISNLLNLLNALKVKQNRLSSKRILAGSVSTANLLVDHRMGASRSSDGGNRETSLEEGIERQGTERQGTERLRNKAHPLLERFSLTDSVIWFSVAAIARILLEIIINSYPITRMPLMFFLFTVISLSIYRVFVSKSSEPISIYRLGITLLGLFLGSAFYQ